MSSAGSGRVLYIIACAAPPALDIHKLMELAQERRWDTCLIVTPEARKFVDEAALEELTGHPVRSEYRRPGEEDPLVSACRHRRGPSHNKHHQQVGGGDQ